MDFYIKNAVMDDPNFNNGDCLWEYSSDSLIFMNSNFEFTSQGPYNYRAKSRIYCSNKSSSEVTNLPYGAPFFVIEPDISVTLEAGNSIVLDKGFHAKAGSSFYASINEISFDCCPIIDVGYVPSSAYLTSSGYNVCYYDIIHADSYDFELYRNENLIFSEAGGFSSNSLCFNVGWVWPWTYTAILKLANNCGNDFIISHKISFYTDKDSLNNTGDSLNTSFLKEQIYNNQIFPEQPNIVKSDKISIFAIYPNPHPGTFNVEVYDETINNFSIEVTNIMGTRVYYRNDVEAGITQIDIKYQTKGIYFVKVQAGDKVYLEKVVYR